VAQKAAYALNAINVCGVAENQALLALHCTLSQVDYARHALDIAEFDKLFDAEIGHLLCKRPPGLPLSLAVQTVEEMLVNRGYAFRIGL
jgi:hypothetical protein